MACKQTGFLPTLRMLALVSFASLLGGTVAVSAAPVSFSGQLEVITTDLGGIYSPAGIGAPFAGTIDDVTASGSITDGVTRTLFTCCIAAGGLTVHNNIALSPAQAGLLNLLLGAPLFSAADLIDLIDLEGDGATPGGGRIEVGLSWVFLPTTFANDAPGNYPFNPADVIVASFFILEEDAGGNELFDATGRLTPVPLLPPALLLLAPAVLLAARRRSYGSRGP